MSLSVSTISAKSEDRMIPILYGNRISCCQLYEVGWHWLLTFICLETCCRLTYHRKYFSPPNLNFNPTKFCKCLLMLFVYCMTFVMAFVRQSKKFTYLLIDGQAYIGLAVLCFFFIPKQVFGPRTAKSHPIWIKLCIHLLFYGIHLWADLDRDRRVGGSRPNQNDCFFL